MRVIRACALASCAAGLLQEGVTKQKQAPGTGDAVADATSRVGSLMTLIDKLKDDFNLEFKEAMETYDKSSCAHEDIIKSSLKNRDAAAAAIRELTTAINKNSADVSAMTATVQQDEFDIAAKNKEIFEAINNRKKEHEAYATEVTELNESIRSAQLAYAVLTKAQTDSQKITSSFGSDALLQSNNEKGLWNTLKTNLEKLPLNGKLMTVDKIEKLNEFLDERMSTVKSSADGGSATALVQFGPASQQVLGILKDMRGQYVAKLQGAQQAEQESAAAHISFVQRARALVKAMVDSMEARKAERDAEVAVKEQNMQGRDAKKTEQKEMDMLMRETKAALADLAKEWGDASASHNDEINGIDKARDYLAQQQGVGSIAYALAGSSAANLLEKKRQQSLLQTAAVVKKPLYENMFQKIAWAIDDMIKAHEESLGENKAMHESCNTQQSQANSQSARKKSAMDALDRKIKELKAEAASTLKAKTKLEGERTDTKNEIAENQSAWEKSDASRTLEIDQLTDSARLITGAQQALSSSGSDRMGDVIAILDMLKNECTTSVKQLTKAKSSEAAEWTESKTAMAKLVLSLSDDIEKHEAKITNLNKKKGEAETKKTAVEGQEPMDMNQCKSFLITYQEGQNGLSQKIQDLTSAKGHLIGWKNSSTTAEHFDSSKTDYVKEG